MSFTTCLKSKTNSLVMELNTSFFSKWWIPSILHYRDLKTPWSLRNTLLLRVNGTEQWFLSFTHFQRLFVKKQHSFGFQWTTNYSIITPPSFSANNVQAVKKYAILQYKLTPTIVLPPTLLHTGSTRILTICHTTFFYRPSIVFSCGCKSDTIAYIVALFMLRSLHLPFCACLLQQVLSVFAKSYMLYLEFQGACSISFSPDHLEVERLLRLE